MVLYEIIFSLCKGTAARRRLIMINLGFAGFRHEHIYSLYNIAGESKNVNIAGAWEDFEEAKKSAETDLNAVFTYESYREMLSDSRLDAIAIGNYYSARGQMIIDALNAGKHVITDKPMCTSLSELSEIKRLAKDKNLIISMMLDLRYSKNVLAAKKIIDEGEIGTVNNICFGGQHPLRYGTRPGWYFEEGRHGGVINDIAVHGIDIIRYIAGLEVKNILAARCWNAFAVKEKHFKDSAQFMLELSNGAGVIADVSYAAPDSIGFALPCYWKFEIWGTKGLLIFSANSDGVQLYKNGNKTVENIKGIQTDRNCLQDFIDEIGGKKDIILNTGEVLKSAESTLAIQQKADTLL